MNRTLYKCLTAASFFFVMLAFFPLLPLLFGSLYHLSVGMDFPCFTSDPIRLLAEFFYCVAVGALGYGTAWLFGDKLQWMPAKRKLCSAPIALLTVLIGFFILFKMGYWRDAMIAVLPITVYFCVGHTVYPYSYEEVITWKKYLITLGVSGGVMLFLQVIAVNPYGIMIFAVCSFLETCLVLFGMNQSNIDFMMKRRKHRMDSLPQKIRSYNLVLLGGILAVILVLFLLHRPIGALVGWIGEQLLALLKWLLHLLGLLLFGKEKPVGGGSGDDPGMNIPDPKGTGSTSSGSWLWVAVTGLLAAFLVFFVWYNRRNIARLFRELWKKLTRWLRHLLFDGHARAKEDFTDFYSEIDEHVLPEEQLSDTRDDAKQMSWSAWRRAYHKFGGMPENDEKYRYGYRLVIEWLKTQGVEVTPDATTLDICRMSREKSRIFPDLKPHTASYNDLRYGEQAFELASLEGLKKALHTMSQLKPAN